MAQETQECAQKCAAELIKDRMRECELTLSEAKRELLAVESSRYQILAKIKEIEHDIAFLTEHLAFPDMVKPYDFSKSIRTPDEDGAGEIAETAPEEN